MRNKNKKGEMELLWKVIGYLFSGIVIVILLYFGYKLLTLSTVDSNSQKCARLLSSLRVKLDAVNKSGILEDSLLVFPPVNWYLRSYVGGDTPVGECLKNKYCLCMCDDISCSGFRNCTGYDYNTEVVGTVQGSGAYGGAMGYAPPPTLYKNIIQLEKAVESIKLNNDGQKITLSKIK